MVRYNETTVRVLNRAIERLAESSPELPSAVLRELIGTESIHLPDAILQALEAPVDGPENVESVDEDS